MVAKNVFLNSDNTIVITILDKRIVDDDNHLGTPIPFLTNGVDKMVVYRFDNDAVIADSSVDDKITYDDNGKITLKLGDIDKFSIAKFRSYDTYIKAFSATNTNGQTIVHNKFADSNLSVTFN